VTDKKAFSNLKRMRQFYLTFPPIQNSPSQNGKGAALRHLTPQANPLQKSAAAQHQLLSPMLREELSWTHYKSLIRVKDPKARQWYLNEAADCSWDTRALARQINTLYYERLIATRDKESVKAEAAQNIKHLTLKPEHLIKDPYVLEFLNLNPDLKYLEKDLEKALLDKLQQFLLELGKGFCFFARQFRLSTETSEFYIDLVFYNYLLKCFVLIDLKTGQLNHQDIGQMDMYVRIFEDRVKPEGDNPTIGIILCTEKDETVVQYSVLSESKQLFASKYKLYLPTEDELIEEIEREKAVILSLKK
jgi:predicted nuclease of restriction endonuclease-like (RecB) superfamily